MSGLSTLHVISGLHPSHGGPTVCVPRLCNAIADLGCAAYLLTVRDPGSPRHLATTYCDPDFRYIPGVSRFKFSRAMQRELEAKVGLVSVVHSHGFWRMPNVYAGRASARAEKPLIVSVHGMLHAAALSRAGLSKSLFWVALQGPAYANVAAWHATSGVEAEAIREFGLKGPVAIIPNGVDLPPITATHDDKKEKRTLLFLSRLHPHKGISELIAAWAMVGPQRPNWTLVLAGQGDSRYRAELDAFARNAGVKQIRFVGEVFGEAKAAIYRDADLFVLPSKSENFGLVVAEALAAGVPAIVTKGAPWRELESRGCGWWTETAPESLAAAILRATDLSADERRSMGARGRIWMADEFSWTSVAQKMVSLYSWVVGQGSCPDSVI